MSTGNSNIYPTECKSAGLLTQDLNLLLEVLLFFIFLPLITWVTCEWVIRAYEGLLLLDKIQWEYPRH